MKSILGRASALVLVALPTLSVADWQIAKSANPIPTEPFFQAGQPQSSSMSAPPSVTTETTDQFAALGQPSALYAISISGSVKENIERIMDQYHWKVIWKAPYDYNFDGRISGSSLPNVMQKLLSPFPLQAIMYMSNRTMTVIPRKV